MSLRCCSVRLAPLALLAALAALTLAPVAPAAGQAPPPPPPEAAPLLNEHGHGHSAEAPEAPAPEEDAPALPRGRSPVDVFAVDFMRRALVTGLMVAAACALLGLYVVLRRIVFLGIALAEVSAAGVALALLVGISPALGSLAATLLGVGLFSVRWAPRRVAQESFIGIGWAAASALGILLIAKSAQGEAHLMDLLFGDILTAGARGMWLSALVLAGVMALLLLLAKEFLFVSFDPETAAAVRYHPRLWDLLLYLALGLTISFSIREVGVLMAFSAMVLPPVAALLLTRSMRAAAATSVLVGVLPVPLGLYLSFVLDLPTSATVVAVSFGLLVLSATGARLLSLSR